jgi:TolB-like protein/AraC-like DNA-binding protein/Tfp pilus assembly protein PilF
MSIFAVVENDKINISFEGEFIQKARAFVLRNLSNEAFGVSELAGALIMSRSTLLRKIKKQTGLSASQFIRNIRLEEGKKLLLESELTVSEISYEVGFSDNSYFIKCFREQYGYPPGALRKKGEEEKIELARQEDTIQKEVIPERRSKKPFFWISSLIILLITAFFVIQGVLGGSKKGTVELEKSIAVLPFKNLSSDSTNLYFVNGLMESCLNKLQKIEALRVISRTSVEKFRASNRTAAEIAEELNVSYLVEGSGQRADGQVLLNIQLIRANDDTPIWTEQYQEKVTDIFSLQNAVAKKIANAIEANVTPSELEQIEKKPTENLEAYEFFIQGLEPFQEESRAGLEKAIPFFEKAIEADPEFALAYSKLAVSYYFLDIYKAEKKYTDIINNYADKALLYDAKSAESLIAKALYYIHTKEFKFAIPHLEKALEYNPNASSVINFLSDIYARVVPNTEKYLYYALKGLQVEVNNQDSVAKSYTHLHLSNALIQTGFIDEAYEHINQSLAYNPNNPYSPYLKVYIEYAKHQNMATSTEALLKELQKDTNRVDLLQEVAKFYYFQEDYERAYHYYHKFNTIKKNQGLVMYPQENLKIGFVYEQLGKIKEAKTYFDAYDQYLKEDESIYKSVSQAELLAYQGRAKEAVERLYQFSNENNYQYWILLFLGKDPIFKTLEKEEGYSDAKKKIHQRFWENHRDLKNLLEDQGLL